MAEGKWGVGGDVFRKGGESQISGTMESMERNLDACQEYFKYFMSHELC